MVSWFYTGIFFLCLVLGSAVAREATHQNVSCLGWFFQNFYRDRGWWGLGVGEEGSGGEAREGEGQGEADEASLACLLFISCCVAGLLTGHGPSLQGLVTPDLRQWLPTIMEVWGGAGVGFLDHAMCMQDLSSSTRDQTCGPLHRKLKILTTGPSGKSFKGTILMIYQSALPYKCS